MNWRHPVTEGTVDETIARLNIEHYCRKLCQETDEAKRQTLQRLLVEEEAKLAQIMKQQQEQKRSG
jgi:predicted secreted protein